MQELEMKRLTNQETYDAAIFLEIMFRNEGSR
jgi:hypothetical protein